MSNDGPRKPAPFDDSYEAKQGLYHSLPAATRASLGRSFTKALSEREHISGLQPLNNGFASTPLTAIAEVDEEESATEAAAPSTYSRP